MRIVNLALKSGQTLRFQATTAGFIQPTFNADGSVATPGQFHWELVEGAGLEIPYVDASMIAAMSIQDVVDSAAEEAPAEES